MKPVICTVCKIVPHDVVSSWIIADDYGDLLPWEWVKQSSTTVEDATPANMVELIAESHMEMQQLISCRLLICLQLCQGKEVG